MAWSWAFIHRLPGRWSRCKRRENRTGVVADGTGGRGTGDGPMGEAGDGHSGSWTSWIPLPFAQHSPGIVPSSVPRTAHPGIELSDVFFCQPSPNATLPIAEWMLRTQQLVPISSPLGNLETHFQTFPLVGSRLELSNSVRGTAVLLIITLLDTRLPLSSHRAFSPVRLRSPKEPGTVLGTADISRCLLNGR